MSHGPVSRPGPSPLPAPLSLKPVSRKAPGPGHGPLTITQTDSVAIVFRELNRTHQRNRSRPPGHLSVQRLVCVFTHVCMLVHAWARAYACAHHWQSQAHRLYQQEGDILERHLEKGGPVSSGYLCKRAQDPSSNDNV